MLFAAVVLATIVIAVGVIALASSTSARPAGALRIPPGAALITVTRTPLAKPIPPGFLGLSFEYRAVEAYAGTNPHSVDPVLEQLIRNLGQKPVLRIGGDSTDWTWWPVPGESEPLGVSYSLSGRWLAVMRAVAAPLHAHLILGINLEADNQTVAAEEARALVSGLGRGSVEALEIGNEPELYGKFIWGEAGTTGRPSGYDFADFKQDFTRLGSALAQYPLAGPAIGAPEWFRNTAEFIAAEPRVGMITLHRYPLQQCFATPGHPNYPTIGNLLSSTASAGMADSVAPYTAIAHAHGLHVRIDEMSTVSCGAAPAVSHSFASALWVLDAMFEMARVGVDGVNIHSYPGATYELFTFTHTHGVWEASIEPQYYGMLMFAQAVPPGSQLMRLSVLRGGAVKSWATRGRDGHIRVVLINDSARDGRVVGIRAPKTSSAAMLERLEAPGLLARGGVTLGGQSFGARTSTGVLAPARTVSVPEYKGSYAIRLPAASAALLTIP